MTEITIRDYEIRIKGHAGYDRNGYDIVCSALSMLTFCLKTATENAESKGMLIEFTYCEKPGDVKVTCKPNQYAKKEVDFVLDVIKSGFRALSAQYPKNVRVNENE